MRSKSGSDVFEMSFVDNELGVFAKSRAQVDALAARIGATEVTGIQSNENGVQCRMRVVSARRVDDLASLLVQHGIHGGNVSFSSERGARMYALTLSENDAAIREKSGRFVAPAPNF
jgi:hypothetical protein